MNHHYQPATAGPRDSFIRASKKLRMDPSTVSPGPLTPQSTPFATSSTDFTFTSPSSVTTTPLHDMKVLTTSPALVQGSEEQVADVPKKRGAGKKRKVEESEFADDKDHGMDGDLALSGKKKVAARTKKTPTTRKPRAAKVPKASKNKAAYHKNGQVDKPAPHRQPEIFALTRQALCETLPWYNAYQSGPHHSNGRLHGLLCDQETDLSDFFDHQVIITRVGGGRELDANGRMVQAGNQKTNARVKAFQNSMDQHQPIGIIVGQGNTNSPSKLPHYYNVLGWFHITDMWCDISNGASRWMVRLEKIDLSVQSWWAPASQLPDLTLPDASCPMHPCATCIVESKMVYKTGWACLNVDCAHYLNFGPEHSSMVPHPYNPAFLAERTPYIGTTPGPLGPPLLTKKSLEKMGAIGFETACRKGVVCQKCGCCSRRLNWIKWVCENPECSWEYAIEQKPVPITDLLTKQLTAEFDKGGIFKEATNVGEYVVSNYYMPDEHGNFIGVVKHFKASKEINSEENGPNSIFHDLQESDIGLRRSTVRSKNGSPTEMVTSHWSTNRGAPYKYRVTNEEKPFTEAPDAILKTVKRLTWAGEYSLSLMTKENGTPETFQPFNQCLAVGYFEDTHMGYHDDGEKMLGPTVASLSLGCPAIMSFRPKAGNLVMGPVGLNRVTKSPCLQLKLEHGDIMIMHGRDIQKYYEHQVKPQGLLRFALTCRYIRPETFEDPKDRAYVETSGTIPPNFTYHYNGSVGPILRTTEIIIPG